MRSDNKLLFQNYTHNDIKNEFNSYPRKVQNAFYEWGTGDNYDFFERCVMMYCFFEKCK